MILGKHGVSWIGGVVVVEHNVLFLVATLDDLVGSSAKLVLDLVNDGDHERSNDREDKDAELFLELLYDLGQDYLLLG